MPTTSLIKDVSIATGIDSAKIGAGDVSNAEHAYLNSVTSNIQTQVSSTITKSASDPVITTNPSGGVGTVFLNTTSGELYCCTDATTNGNIWTNVGPGTGDIEPFMTATGGTITTVGDYKIHTFNSSSTFTVTGPNSTVEYLVIAGGGGGSGTRAGGGGAGGYRNSYASEITGGGGSGESGLSVTATSYTITVGAGGAEGNGPGVIGSNSIFSTITSTGGGFGGFTQSQTGGTGGSGGGAGSENGSGGARTASPVQGNVGGNASSSSAGGGGGGGGAGGNSTSGVGGAGGIGLSSSITGSGVFRGGGGGGAAPTTDGVGVHGGSTGDSNVNGTANTGGGGGGGWTGGESSGGSGVVIIRYQFQ